MPQTTESPVAPAVCLPGFGRPVDEDFTSTFPSALRSEWRSMGITLREQRMMVFVGDITDKPDWERKVFDEEIVAKWRAEAEERPERLNGDVVLSKEMFDHCIEELRDKAAIFKETGLINILDGDLTIVKSDVAIPKHLRQALCEGIKPLEDVPEHLQDWHPIRGDVILNLVHPSLFPVTYGLTKALANEKVPLDGCLRYIGKGKTIPPFEARNSEMDGTYRDGDYLRCGAPFEWGSFQWLPTDIDVAETGAKILGYINNLHPERHKNLYRTLEEIVGRTIPLWEESLSGFHDRRRIILTSTGEDDYGFPEGFLYRIPGEPEGPRAYYDPTTGLLGDGTERDWNAEWQYEDHWLDWERQHRVLKHPEPRKYIPRSEAPERLKNRVDLRETYPQGLQVIFKLANIELTPGNPEYEAGSWRVEGGLNEMISATAIYYLGQEGVTDGHLAFRQALDEENLGGVPEQFQWHSLTEYLGIEEGGTAAQEIGKVLTREGRMLVFPNCLQHQVQPFELKDKDEPGHRKVLAMYLVDPGRRLLSTSNVPPQRRDWWAEELHREAAIPGLPAELVAHTIDLVDDFPISWDEACEMREELMDERFSGNDAVTERMDHHTFSFSEH